MGFFYLGGLELAMVLEDITQNGSKHRNIASRISGSVDSNVILQNIHTFYKEAITTQFITYQATFTPSAITVHSTENLVDNLFEAIPWRGRNIVSLVLFNLIHICKEVYLFRLVD